MSQDLETARYNEYLTDGLTCSILVVLYITAGLRFLSRRLIKQPLWIDDWSMIFVLAICTFTSICNIVGPFYGSGRDQSTVSDSNLQNFLVNLYTMMLLWVLGIIGVKFTILAFYWRVFQIHGFRRIILIVFAISCTFTFAFMFVFIFQCSPISYFWDKSINGKCINQINFFVISGAINLVGDVTVLMLPIPLIWKLKLSNSQKLGLTLIFLLGIFACLTSIFRILALQAIDPKDFTLTNVAAGIWSNVEIEVGCICANLPHLRPLFHHWFFPNRLPSHKGSRPSGSHPRTGRSSRAFPSAGQGFESSDDRGLVDGERGGISMESLGVEQELGGSERLGCTINVQTKVLHTVEVREGGDCAKPVGKGTFCVVSGPKGEE